MTLSDQSLAIRLRTLQIIVASLTLGPLIFLLVVVFAIKPQQPPALVGFGAVNLTTISLGFAAAAVAVRVFFPATIVRRTRREIAARSNASHHDSASGGDEQRSVTTFALWNAYLVKTIIGGAILEGACFFLIVAYQLERQPIALSTAAAFLTAVACHIPTFTRVENWLESQLQRVKEEQAFQM